MIPMLPKSLFLARLQFPKRLYLECFHQDLAYTFSPTEQVKLDAGMRVGESSCLITIVS